jgi:hypothetical protein
VLANRDVERGEGDQVRDEDGEVDGEDDEGGFRAEQGAEKDRAREPILAVAGNSFLLDDDGPG